MELGIIGAGAWGTAFAIHLARKGYSVLLWAYEPDLVEILKKERTNRYYLPGFSLPPSIRFTNDPEAVTDFSSDLILAPPSFAFRKTIEPISGKLYHKNILILTKGIETETLLRMSEIARQVTDDTSQIAVLSGPSFAKELAAGAFTSVVVASELKVLAKYFQSAAHSDDFRVYTTDDVIGVELGGSLKNVMAIGAGILEGLGLGTNALAAYTTRAIAEIKRLGRALGAKDITFMGLSGIGDLILTSYGNLSRNRQFGIAISQGNKPDHIIASQKSVVEGYYTIDAVHRFADKLGIEMPICEELYKVVYEHKNILESINDIKQREFKEEDC